MLHGDLTKKDLDKEIERLKDIESKRKRGVSQKYQTLKEEKTKAKAQNIKLLDAAKIKPSRHIKQNLKGKYIIGGVVYTILVVAEVLLNASSFQLLQSLFFSILISFGFSICITMLGFGVASLLVNDQMEEKKRNLALGALLLLVAGAFYTLSVLKSSYVSVRPYHQMSLKISPLLFWVLNLVIFVASVFVKLFLLPSKKQIEDNFSYAKAEREVKHLFKTIERLQEELNHLETDKEKELKTIEKESKDKQQALIRKFQSYVDSYNQSVSAFNQVLANLLYHEGYINSFWKEVLSTYVQSLNESRIDGQQLVFQRAIPELKAVFTDYEQKSEYQFTTPSSPTKHHTHSTTGTLVQYQFNSLKS